jgi:DNA modification methylase
LERNSWPADKVERWPIGRLVPYARNARTHSEAQIEQVAASIREWGWTNPVLVGEDGGIIAGHCRVLAGRQLGLAEVPVMLATGWSEAQKRAYVLADNQLALNAGWNPELLRLELGELAGLGFDLRLMGFSESELAGLNPGLTDPDEVPDAPAVPIAQRGEVWQLGRHRLVCGDATAADDVARALAGVQPNLMVTDPPYGVDYDPAWRAEAGINKNRAKMGEVANDDRADWRDAWALFPGDVAYCWHAGKYASVTQQSLEATGLEVRSQIIWAKDRFALSRGHYHWQHEPCWYAVRKSKPAHWRGGRRQITLWPISVPETTDAEPAERTLEEWQLHFETTLWRIEAREDSGHGHGTQKPVECMKRPIENNSSPGQAVYDPFVGSGTTIIAAEMTGRACHAIEINPTYCDVTIERWQNFTGEKARRA